MTDKNLLIGPEVTERLEGQEMTDTELRERILDKIFEIMPFAREDKRSLKLADQLPEALKEPVTIKGRVYHRKLVPDEWDMSSMRNYFEVLAAVDSQIKEA